MSDPKLVMLNDVDSQQAAGIPFKKVDQARWAFRKRNENGLAGAFVTIGRSVMIDVQKFHELASANRI